MKLSDILILVIIFLAYLVIKFKTENTEQENPTLKIYPYKQKHLLTKAEYSFYNTLKKECDKNELLICPKVRMEDFIDITDKSHYQKYRGYIKSRHIDFIICDDKLRLKCGIELDDNSHNKPKVKETDIFKDEVFKTIGLPLYRIKMSEGKYQEQINNIINEIKNKSV